MSPDDPSPSRRDVTRGAPPRRYRARRRPRRKPRASAAPVTTNEDTPVTVTLSATDPDSDPIVDFHVTSGPTNGSLGSVSAIDCVTNAPACTETLTYTPDPNANGTDSFDFTAEDDQNETSSPATASITINAVNDAPSFTKGSNQSKLEDAGLAVHHRLGDGDQQGPRERVEPDGLVPGQFELQPVAVLGRSPPSLPRAR